MFEIKYMKRVSSDICSWLQAAIFDFLLTPTYGSV